MIQFTNRPDNTILIEVADLEKVDKTFAKNHFITKHGYYFDDSIFEVTEDIDGTVKITSNLFFRLNKIDSKKRNHLKILKKGLPLAFIELVDNIPDFLKFIPDFLFICGFVFSLIFLMQAVLSTIEGKGTVYDAIALSLFILYLTYLIFSFVFEKIRYFFKKVYLYGERQ